MINWNDTRLPNPTTCNILHSGATIRSTVTTGRTLQRSRFTQEFENASVSFQLTSEEFQIWKGVWKHYLINGTEWFTMDLPVGGDDILTSCQVRFVTEWKHTYRSHDAVDISAQIEFFEVTVIDEIDLQELIGEINPPYDDAGITLVFNDINTNIKVDFEASNGFYAVRWWDGTIETSASGGLMTKACPTSSAGLLYRVDVWGCISLADTTQIGHLTTMTEATQAENYVRFNAEREPLMNSYFLEPAKNLIGWDKSDTLTVKVAPGGGAINDLRIGDMLYTKHVIIDATDYSAAEFTTWFDGALSQKSALRTITILGQYLARDFHASNCDLRGVMDLSGITINAASNGFNLSGNPLLTGVNFGQCTGYSANLNDCQIDTLTFTEMISFATSVNCQNNSLEVAMVGTLVDNLTATDASVDLNLSGNPCWVGGALDPADPLTAGILAQATINKINIIA